MRAFAWRIYVLRRTVIDLLTAHAMIFFLLCGLQSPLTQPFYGLLHCNDVLSMRGVLIRDSKNACLFRDMKPGHKRMIVLGY